MYKEKYLKYKNKYLLLKGGLPINRIFSTELDFVDNYNLLPGNSFDKLHFFLETRDLEQPLNLLVGVDNRNENDYKRFKDSEYYSLYISSKSMDEGELDPIRQYYMYNIYYEDFYDKIDSFPERMIDNIHFDYYTSYFTPANTYFALMDRCLKIGGKFIFILEGQHSYGVARLVDNEVIFHNERKIRCNDFPEISFDHIKHEIYVSDEKATAFFSENALSPQFSFTVMTWIDGRMQTYKLNYSTINRQYLRYLRERFPNYIVELKSYNFTDMSYPSGIKYVDGRFIDLNPDLNYLFNTVMNPEEKSRYLETKKLTEAELTTLLDRIRSSEEHRTELFRLTNTEDRDNLERHIYEQLLIDNFYIEMTRLS
jgi:hypothetical protein